MRTMTSVILFLSFFSIIVSSCSLDSKKPVDYSNRGIWFWAEPKSTLGSSQILANQLEQQRAIDFLSENEFSRLYGEYQDTANYLIADWNESLNKAGIESQLLLAENVWIFPRQRHLLFERIQKELVDFNNSVDNNEQKFKALHLNIEPHALDLWKQASPTKRRDMLEQLLDTIKESRAYLDKNSKDEIKIYFDLVVWYDEINGTIAWQNKSDRDDWYTRFTAYLDGLSLMAYARGYEAIIVNTAWEIENLDTSINIAIDADIGEGRFWPTRAKFVQVLKQLEAQFTDKQNIDIHSFLSYYDDSNQ